jgi:hypothetical protein
VLAVHHAAHLLASGTGEDADAVDDDAVPRLPVLVALERRLWAPVVDLAVFEAPVTLRIKSLLRSSFRTLAALRLAWLRVSASMTVKG